MPGRTRSRYRANLHKGDCGPCHRGQGDGRPRQALAQGHRLEGRAAHAAVGTGTAGAAGGERKGRGGVAPNLI